MKTSAILGLTTCLVLLAFAGEPLRAQSGNGTYDNLTVNDNLTVSGTAFLSTAVAFGTWGAYTGLTLNYVDIGSGSTQINFTGSGSSVVWQWLDSTGTGSSYVMQLDQNNQLLLYSGGTSGITLNPASTGTSTFSGNVIVSGDLTTSGSDNELPHQQNLNGYSILTTSIGNTLYLPLSATSSFVSSSDFLVGSATDYGDTGPTVALPYGTATGAYSFASIGSTASGYISNASGIGSSAIGDYSTASGFGSSASGPSSVASGINSIASGTLSLAVGSNSIASGLNSTALSWDSTASGLDSLAVGPASTASGAGAVSLGQGSVASGEDSVGLGFLSTAVGAFSTAAGRSTTAQGYGQFVVGQYNILQGGSSSWTGTDNLFIIGNGSYGTPSNAFEVSQNGDTTVSGVLNVSGTTSGTSGEVNTITNGGLVLTGSTAQILVGSGTTPTPTVVATGTTNLLLVPQQGDLLMGPFVGGQQPPTTP